MQHQYLLKAAAICAMFLFIAGCGDRPAAELETSSDESIVETIRSTVEAATQSDESDAGMPTHVAPFTPASAECSLPVSQTFGPIPRSPSATFSWSPKGDWIAFGWQGISILDLTYDVPNPVQLIESDGSYPVWSPDGEYIAYLRQVRASRNWSQELHVTRVDRSESWLLSDGLLHAANPIWTAEGERVGFNAQEGYIESFYVANRDGSGRKQFAALSGIQGRYASVWSPDEQRIAFMAEPISNPTHRPGMAIYVMNVDGSEQERLTNDEFCNMYPAWSPDGRQLAYISDRNGRYDLFIMDADGSKQTRLTDSPGHVFQFDWSPDGQRIAYVMYQSRGWGEGDFQLSVVGARGGEPERLITISEEQLHLPQWSADGQHLAVLVFRDGEWFIDVITVGTGSRRRLETAWPGGIVQPQEPAVELPLELIQSEVEMESELSGLTTCSDLSILYTRIE